MAYKKYIKKDGKLYGPYIYESHRVDGKVISEYHGVDNSKSRKLLWLGLGLLAFVILFFSVFYAKGRFTGNVVDLSSGSQQGATLETETKIIYPVVYFTLVSRQIENNSSEQISPQQENNNTTQTDNETDISKQIPIIEEQTQGQTAPAETNETAPITGGIISEIFSGISNFFLSLTPTGNAISENILETQINGQVSANEQFEYVLKQGESIEILSGSVKTNSKELSDDAIKLSVEEGKAIVTTDYFEEETQENKNSDILPETNSVPEENLEPNAESNATISNLTEVTITQANISRKFLSGEEKEILIHEFGNSSIETIKSELFNNRYVIGYRIGNYEIEYSYDAELDNETLNLQMENDRIKWLKDIIKRISQSEISGEEAGQFINNYPI